ncbi:MAG: SDR family oxidoreductase [Chloroflexi bacterium]|nr:SDR family oxidoreductase [Chloroflexota bacterium]
MAQTFVITGSTRGIGKGMALAALERGHNVVINGRGEDSVAAAVAELVERCGPDHVAGQAADISEHAAVERLWRCAVERFGRVDYWINNAAVSYPAETIWAQAPAQLSATIDINLRGLLFGSTVAVRKMLDQGGGRIYNMEGMGSDGTQVPRTAVYGTTKYGIRYLTSALIRETADTPVRVGTLRPGMVTTEMLALSLEAAPPDRVERTKRIFNVLADRVDTVAPWLIDQILQDDGHGSVINWMPTHKVLWRFLSSPFVKRNLID